MRIAALALCALAHYLIEAEKCTECEEEEAGSKCVPVGPVDCIVKLA